MAISGSDDQLSQSLLSLHNAIAALSPTIPEAKEDGPLTTYLCDFDVNEEEGPFYSFNRSWDFASHFDRVPRIKAHSGLTLLQA
ncbi:hypothetical protein DFH29DRAFT_1010523 [Suillus ampliporus]|nr:hypothetical protein DFH29DRAFT_1010523 [Suillus ampliporus]